MTSPLFVRKLNETEQATLNEWLHSKDIERARRAQVILQSVAGKTAIEIGQEIGFHPDNLKKWIRRFNEQGIGGIEVLKRGPRNRFSSEQVTALLDLYQQSPEQLGLPLIASQPTLEKRRHSMKKSAIAVALAAAMGLVSFIGAASAGVTCTKLATTWSCR